MPTTTLKQKILLICLGILFTFVLLEVFLRIGGFIFNLNQDRYNKITRQHDQNEFRVLCLGESTTAIGGRDSFPYQLEEILNEKKLSKKIKVINKGAVSKKSDYVFRHLKENLDQYNPDLVVIMLGINDALDRPSTHLWLGRIRDVLQNFRSYKLLELAGMHLAHKFHWVRQESPDLERDRNPEDGLDMSAALEEEIRPDGPGEIQIEDSATMEKVWMQNLIAYQSAEKQLPLADSPQLREHLRKLRKRQTLLGTYIGRYYRLRKEYPQAERYLTVSLSLDPTNYSAYIELGRCYKELGQYPKAISFFEKALGLNPEKRGLALLDLGRCYDKLGIDAQTFKSYEAILKEGTNFFWIYPEVGNWFKDHGFLKQAEEAYLKAVKSDSRDGYLYNKLSQVYQTMGNKQLAANYEDQFKRWQEITQTYSAFTIRNYNDIVDLITARGIKVICMQYPRREIASLKDVFVSARNIVFVENRINFTEALKGSEYTKYFSDSFAGDFGHCTRDGNRLIAQNLADTIVREYFSKN